MFSGFLLIKKRTFVNKKEFSELFSDSKLLCAFVLYSSVLSCVVFGNILAVLEVWSLVNSFVKVHSCSFTPIYFL